ncbi:MAG: hypothetical protein Q7K35_02785 [bacterium]|nr:hypothetical protein [bacterium]
MKKIYKKILISVGSAVTAAFPLLVLAANPALEKLDNVATVGGPYKTVIGEIALTEIIGTVVGAALGLIGVIFLLLMIYAGYNWMTAQGEEEKVTKAKDTIIRAVIGIIIVVGAYAIWAFVFSKLF